MLLNGTGLDFEFLNERTVRIFETISHRGERTAEGRRDAAATQQFWRTVAR